MRGSTTAILQPNGSLITGYSYDAFGELSKRGASDFLNDVTFTGSVSDTSSGLQYMNARYYQPSTGRFLTQDTYSGNAYDPWTQHLYNYCGNNPTSMVDPTGHFFLTCLIVGAIVGAIIGASVVGYEDYKDDGEIFNGSKTFGDYALGAGIGAVGGAAVGAAVGGVIAAGGVSAAASAVGGTVRTAASFVGAKAVAAGTFIATQGRKVVEGVKNIAGKAGQAISNVSDKVKSIESGSTNVVDKVKSIESSSTNVVSQTSQTMQTYYPPNDGFMGTVEKVSLKAGDMIDRIGPLSGRYTSPTGTPWQTLSLPYDKIGQAATQLRVVKSFEVLAGRAAPWFQSTGGGMQYYMFQSVQRLIDSGFLE